MMSESRESSVRFSLDELMRLEQQRVTEEEDQRLALANAERERREAELRAEQQAQRARQRALEQERLTAELRQREQEIRVEALRQAELLRAHREAEHAARLQELECTQEHEQRLARGTRGRKLELSLVGSGALLLVAGLLAVAFFARLEDRHELTKAEFAREAQAQRLAFEADRQALSGQIRQRDQALEELRALVASGRTRDVDRANPTPEPKPESTHGLTRPPVRDRTLTPPPKPPCPDGDPMCTDM